jgi:hypothetical protein
MLGIPLAGTRNPAPDKKMSSPNATGTVVCQVFEENVVEPHRAVGENVMTASGMVTPYPMPVLRNTLELVRYIWVVDVRL